MKRYRVATGCVHFAAGASGTRLTWQRMSRLIDRWLPPVRIVHPQPSVRFDART